MVAANPSPHDVSQPYQPGLRMALAGRLLDVPVSVFMAGARRAPRRAQPGFRYVAGRAVKADVTVERRAS